MQQVWGGTGELVLTSIPLIDTLHAWELLGYKPGMTPIALHHRESEGGGAWPRVNQLANGRAWTGGLLNPVTRTCHAVWGSAFSRVQEPGRGLPEDSWRKEGVGGEKGERDPQWVFWYEPGLALLGQGRRERPSSAFLPQPWSSAALVCVGGGVGQHQGPGQRAFGRKDLARDRDREKSG